MTENNHKQYNKQNNERKQLVERYMQKGQLLTLSAPTYQAHVLGLLQWLIAGDHVQNDVTTRTLKLNHQTTATIESRQTGVLAGIEEVLMFLGHHPEVSVEAHYADGDTVNKGDVILSLSLNIADLLALERTMLNVIGRMSGIATATQQLVAMTGGYPCIAGTRKTPWMMLDKKAVYCGGGLTHRLHLGDAILVKDNHLKAFMHQSGQATLEATVREVVAALIRSGNEFFEVEVENFAQAEAALDTFNKAGATASHKPVMLLLLDNISAAEAGQFIQRHQHERVLYEASGDINESTIPGWLNTGVDVLSLGALTHSVKNFNISMAM